MWQKASVLQIQCLLSVLAALPQLLRDVCPTRVSFPPQLSPLPLSPSPAMCSTLPKYAFFSASLSSELSGLVLGFTSLSPDCLQPGAPGAEIARRVISPHESKQSKMSQGSQKQGRLSSCIQMCGKSEILRYFLTRTFLCHCQDLTQPVPISAQMPRGHCSVPAQPMASMPRGVWDSPGVTRGFRTSKLKGDHHTTYRTWSTFSQQWSEMGWKGRQK